MKNFVKNFYKSTHVESLEIKSFLKKTLKNMNKMKQDISSYKVIYTIIQN
jgi:hypothetical protein